ncbi:hypothetical protein [Streptomyces sp. KL116D]|uniref:hypothetical protein n=1 Tax=Streptomyces sp. KL116D TaxID=3045152 RepID=UPI0035571CE5
MIAPTTPMGFADDERVRHHGRPLELLAASTAARIEATGKPTCACREKLIGAPISRGDGGRQFLVVLLQALGQPPHDGRPLLHRRRRPPRTR